MDLPPPAPLRCACSACHLWHNILASIGLPPATSPMCTSGQCACVFCERARNTRSAFLRDYYFSYCEKKERPRYSLRPSARKPAGFYKE